MLLRIALELGGPAPPTILFKEVVWLLGGNTVSAESLNRDILAHSPSRDPLPLLAHKAVFDASEGPWQCDFNPYLSTTSPTPSLVALPTRPSPTAFLNRLIFALVVSKEIG